MSDGYGQEIYNEAYTMRFKLDDIDCKLDTISSYMSKADTIEEYLSQIIREISGLRRDMREIAGGGKPPHMRDAKGLL